MVRINHIGGLNAYTSSGDRLNVKDIKGNPVKGSVIQCVNGEWEVVGSGAGECEM